jgi:hypothetical protein
MIGDNMAQSMNIRGQRLMRWLLVVPCVALTQLVSAANLPLVHSCLAHDSQGCSVSVSVHKRPLSMWLDKPDGSVPAELASVLQAYYAAARANDTVKIAEKFSVADKSRAQITEEMRKNPGKYARFYQVKAVKLTMLVNIGSYFMVGVEWYGEGNKRLAGWSELVICEDDCEMSAQLLSETDPQINFANVVVFPGDVIQQPVGTHLVEYPRSSDKSGSFGYVQNADKGRLNKQFGVINELKQAFGNNAGDIANAGNDVVARILSLMTPYWNNPDATDTTYLPRPGADGLRGLNVISLYSVLSGVKKLIPLTLVAGNDVDFVFFNMVFSEADQRLAFMAVGRNGKIVPQIQLSRSDAVIAQAFQTSVIYQDMRQRLIP